MTWHDELRDASFRGIPFLVSEHEATGGRRGSTHEYPQRDEPFAEDMGRRARGYNLQAFVLGPEYFAGRDALIDAMNQEGPGTLVHPYLGSVIVQPRNYGVRETTRRGGMAIFRLRFEEAGENQYPARVSDTGNAVSSAADDAWIPILTEFEGTWSVSKVDWLASAAEDLVADAADSMEGSLSGISTISGDLEGFTQYLEDLRSDSSELVTTPTQLATKISEGLVSIASLPASTVEGFQALVGLGAFSPLLVEFAQTTPDRFQQSINETEFLGLFRRGAAIEAARMVPDMSFASRSDARDVRGTITELLDTEILAAGDGSADDVLQGLTALYAAVVSDLQARGASLALIRNLTPSATEPALVLAHRLYQDASRDQEIVDRNSIRHPGFVPGGVSLEVLTDAP